MFWPLNVTGLDGSSSWSFPNAMKLPVMVSAPNRTSNPSAAITGRETSAPWPRCQYSATPTSVAATAPNMCEIAIRCGIAVIGTYTPSGYPMSEPSTSPAMIHS